MDPIQALLLQANQPVSQFPANSRYQPVPTRVHTANNGEQIVHLKRRFVPRAESLTTLHHHLVRAGERLDNITHKHFNDPELFWRLCDANKAMHPLELTETPDRLIRVTMPEGL